MHTHRRIVVALAAIFVGLGLVASPAAADHSWGGYHWARTANPFTLQLGDNVTSAWDSYLRSASGDWTQSAVLDTVVTSGQNLSNPKRCQLRSGRVEVCNSSYGNNGWLGIASISVSGSHILAGVTKLNDTYFKTATYNTPAWRQFVMCQEIGHTFGLDHQDENFDNSNLGSCMDYTNSPGTNQRPNAHDFSQLENIYSHLDSTTTVGSSRGSVPANAGGNSQAEWGRAIDSDGRGRPDLFVLDHGNNRKTFTFVLWA